METKIKEILLKGQVDLNDALTIINSYLYDIKSEFNFNTFLQIPDNYFMFRHHTTKNDCISLAFEVAKQYYSSKFTLTKVVNEKNELLMQFF